MQVLYVLSIPVRNERWCTWGDGFCLCLTSWYGRGRYAPPADLSNLREEYENLADKVDSSG